MGLHTGNDNSQNNGFQGTVNPQTEQTTINNDTGLNEVKELSLIDNGATLLTGSTTGIEATVLDHMSKYIKSNNINDVFMLSVSKTVYTNLAYSFILFGIKDGTTVGYYPVLIEATGPTGMTVEKYIQMKENKVIPFIPSDAIDEYAIPSFEKKIKATVNNVGNMYMIGGLIIPAFADVKDENYYDIIIPEIINNLRVELGIKMGRLSDGNIPKDLERYKARVSVAYKTELDQHMDISGIVKKPTFSLESALVPMTNNYKKSPNESNTEVKFSTVYGRVDFIVDQASVPNAAGIPVTKNVLRPIIKILDFENKIPSLGYALYSIYSATLMFANNAWMKPILDGAQKNVGELNKIIDINNDYDKGGKPKALQLDSNKLSKIDKIMLLSKLAPLEPRLSINCLAFAGNSTVLRTLTAAANGIEEAGLDIIDSLYKITNGKFNKNFPVNKIFKPFKANLPYGKAVASDNKVHTSDELDAIFFATTGSSDVFSRYYATEYPVNGSANSFDERVELLNEIGLGHMSIENNQWNLVFEEEFLQELIRAFQASGVTPTFDIEDIRKTKTGFGFLNGLFSNTNIAPTVSTIYGNQNTTAGYYHGGVYGGIFR